MRFINITEIIENIVAFLRPYETEIQLVPDADKPYVLRRIQREVRHHILANCSSEQLACYRQLEQSVQADLERFLK